MKQIAPGLWHISSRMPNAINCYLAGDVLVDAATRLSARRLIKTLGNRELSAHVLTHAHPDHQGATHAICERYGCPLLVGETDAEAVETGDLPGEKVAATWVQRTFWQGPPHPVATRLSEGDEVAGFRVVDTPGHTPGHIALFRESDRVLIAGDVLNNMDLRTGRPGLHLPPDPFTSDPEENKRSVRLIADLEPALVVFGHGPPLRDPRKLAAFVAALP